jgi:hypothetical protein
MSNAHLHLERLRRHYEIAVRTHDHVAFLDLSHVLRVWADLKAGFARSGSRIATARMFKTSIPARKVLKAARGHRYVFCYMPGGVRTLASGGTLAQGPEAGHDSLTVGISVRVRPPVTELARFCMVATAFEEPLIKALEAEQTKRCTFSQWLAAEAVRVCYPDPSGTLQSLTISREAMIRRVANTLDGSHPSLPAVSGDSVPEHTIDEAIRHLLQYNVGGLPLPYFILLKVAQDILELAPGLLCPEPTDSADA